VRWLPEGLLRSELGLKVQDIFVGISFWGWSEREHCSPGPISFIFVLFLIMLSLMRSN